MFELQVQTGPACFITSVAMVIGKPVQEVIDGVGKPYMDIIHPGRTGDEKYRGHHPQDFTKYLQDLGYVMSVNFAKYPIYHPYFGKGCLLCGGNGKFRGRWEEFDLPLEGNVGVLHYQNHACAWDGSKVYDPNGKIYEFHTTRLTGFHPIQRIQRHEIPE